MEPELEEMARTMHAMYTMVVAIQVAILVVLVFVAVYLVWKVARLEGKVAGLELAVMSTDWFDPWNEHAIKLKGVTKRPSHLTGKTVAKYYSEVDWKEDSKDIIAEKMQKGCYVGVREVDENGETTKATVQCMLTGLWCDPAKNQHCAAHVAPRQTHPSTFEKLGLDPNEARDSTRNLLALCKGIETVFDQKRIAFGLVSSDDDDDEYCKFKVKVWDPKVLTKQVFKGSSVTIEMIKDRLLRIPKDKRPYTRLLDFHNLQCYYHAMDQGWLDRGAEKAAKPANNGSPIVDGCGHRVEPNLRTMSERRHELLSPTATKPKSAFQTPPGRSSTPPSSETATTFTGSSSKAPTSRSSSPALTAASSIDSDNF